MRPIYPHSLVNPRLTLTSTSETFEGLGIGSRLAYMKLPARYNYIPIVAALVYGLTTPLGLAIGLGVRTS